MKKICYKCKKHKEISDFHKDKSRSDKLQSKCKSCGKTSKQNPKYKEMARKYEKTKKVKYYKKIYWKSNNYKKLQKIRRQGELYKKYQREYSKKRRSSDANYKLRRNLRSRLNMAIKVEYKSGSAVQDLGCTIPELKIHLENQFTEGMSWGNWCRDGWHIDHKIPLASFDLTNREELLRAVHYTNLQPLWGRENESKGNKLLTN